MPSFDVVSRVDLQEVRNAVDQAGREVATRFDFKNTSSSIDLGEGEIVLRSNGEQRVKALLDVLEEKLVKRKVPLKALGRGRIEEAAGGTYRQVLALNVGISQDKGREIGKFIRDHGPKGVQAQIQADQLRVTGKKRDDLQAVIAALRDHDFAIPLQFVNMRD